MTPTVLKKPAVTADSAEQNESAAYHRINAEMSDVLLKCSPDCVKLLSAEGNISFFNTNGLCAMEIDDFSSVNGVYWPSIWPECHREDARKAVAVALKGGTGTFSGFCPTAKGANKWWDVLVTALPNPGGAPDRLLVISRDVTAQTMQQAATQAAHARLKTISAVTNDVLWDIDLATGNVWWSEGMLPVFGYGPEHIGPDTKWCFEHIHPEDRKRIAESMQRACDDGSTHWQSEFRYLKADGAYAHVADRGIVHRNQIGQPIRFMGAMQDISARYASAERQDLLSRELAHRVNNTLAVVQGLWRQTSRHAAEDDTFEKRLSAMANATGCLLNGQWTGADLEELATAQLAPFMVNGERRILIEGPKLSIGADSARALAMAFYELATNAIKYGALSTSTGLVSLTWSVEAGSTVSIVWRERDGPRVSPPTTAGFGTTLIERGIPQASVLRVFDPEGLTCSITLPLNEHEA